MSRPQERIFYPQLESLRGLAALSVVLFHMMRQAETVPIGSVSFAEYAQARGLGEAIYFHGLGSLFNSNSAVMLFFVLSGFVMGVNVRTDKKLELGSYSAFIVRRAFRLLPIIPIGIALAVLLRQLPVYSADRPDLRIILNGLSLRDITLDGPLWTLRVEIVMSAVYLFMLYYVRWTSYFMQAVGLYALFWLANHVDLGWRWGGMRVDLYLYCFYLGVTIPSLGKLLIEWLPAPLRLALLAAALFQYWTWGILVTHEGAWNLASQALSAWYIICWVTYGSTAGVGQFLAGAKARYLGRISFSLYALHWPLVVALALIVKATFGGPFTNVFVELGEVLIVLPISLLLAHLCYTYVERPCIDAGHKAASLIGSITNYPRIYPAAAEVADTPGRPDDWIAAKRERSEPVR